MSLVVRVLAPTGRDAELISSVLRQNGVAAESLALALTLGDPELDPPGPLLLAEEALDPTLSQHLRQWVHDQPAWSDLPILVMTTGARETIHSRRRAEERLPLGAILLERPIHTASLLSSVRAALRARARQYEIRDAVANLRRAVVTIEEERQTLQAVLDNLPVGVALAKPSGEIALYNRRLLELFPPGSAAGTWPAWPIFHPGGSFAEPQDRPLHRAMRTGRAVPLEEFLYEREPGSRTWIGIAASPILNHAGTPTAAVITVADIDYQKRSELALIQSEKLAAVGRLAASISHEINNPLESVTNLLYLARHAEGLSPELQDYLDTADRELGRVSQIASQTLRFHRQSTRARALSAKELLEPTLGLYSGRLHNSRITLTVQHRGTVPAVCFEGEIRQVLNNLVGNALESMRTGGQLLIRTSNARLWKTNTPAMRITVADTGHGMAPEIARRIFEAFYTTKGINGTGLGLWISRGIVDKHFGRLQVRSSTRPTHSGTIFSLVLPHQPFPTPPPS